MAVSTFPYFSNVAGVPADPNFFELEIGWKADDSAGIEHPLINVFNFARISDGAGPVVLQDIIDNAIATYTLTAIDTLLSTNTIGTLPRVRAMDDPSLPWLDGAVTTTGGSDAGLRSPLYESVTWRGVSSARGRHYRTNKHFSGLTESPSGGDQLGSGAITAWNVAIVALVLGLKTFVDSAGNNLRLVMLSRSLCSLTGLPTSFTGCNVDDYTLNTTLTTMRRRREKV